MGDAVVEFKGIREDLAKGFAEYAASLGAAFIQPESILSRLRDYVAQHPELVDMGYWLYLEKNPEYDKGFRITLYRRPAWRDLSLGMLLGQSTTGFDLQTPIYKRGDLTFSVGVGVVSPHENFLKKWYPAITCSFRVPLT